MAIGSRKQGRFQQEKGLARAACTGKSGCSRKDGSEEDSLVTWCQPGGYKSSEYTFLQRRCIKDKEHTRCWASLGMEEMQMKQRDTTLQPPGIWKEPGIQKHSTPGRGNSPCPGPSPPQPKLRNPRPSLTLTGVLTAHSFWTGCKAWSVLAMFMSSFLEGAQAPAWPG